MSSIRLASEGDAAALLAIYEPFVRDSATTFELETPSVPEFAARIRSTLPKTPWLVHELGGVVTGYAYACPHRERKAYQWSVEVSAYVAAPHRGKGVGRALYGKLFELLRRQGYYNAYAGVTLPNPASVGLHEALGFRPIGVYRSVGFKKGSWHDVGWWGLQLQPLAAEPVAPLALAELGLRGGL